MKNEKNKDVYPVLAPDVNRTEVFKGKENMSIMEKILFVADATGKDRTYDNTEYIHNLAKKNIDKAVTELLKEIIIDVIILLKTVVF